MPKWKRTATRIPDQSDLLLGAIRVRKTLRQRASQIPAVVFGKGRKTLRLTGADNLHFALTPRISSYGPQY